MSISLRFFLGYFLLIGIGGYILLNTFMTELRPGVRQSMEDTMVDMSNLLAEIATPYVTDNGILIESSRLD
ncbi:MAG: hypothetical protein KBT53_04850, partial [Porticoccus sp.]|nr:hypothetical protein [Porticoccus sp.]